MVAALLGAILSGVPVMLVIAGVPTLIAVLASFTGHFDLVYFQAVPQRVFGIMENPLLIAVPLFVLVGILLERSRQAERMLANLNQLMGGSQPALALSVVLVSALVAASTGIIGATIVMLGTISLPSLLRAGIDKKTASGLICACGTLGQIIPPSIVLILLGDQISNAYIEAQQREGNFAPDPVTVGDLFAGALVPGLLLVGLYAAYVMIRLRDRPGNPSADQPRAQAVPVSKVLLQSAPTFALILAVLGSILIGIATPTEAASIGVAGTLLIAASQVSRADAVSSLATASLAIVLLALRLAGLIGVEFADGGILYSGLSILTLGLVLLLAAGLMRAAFTLLQNRVLIPALTETLMVSGMIFGIVVAASILSLVFRGFGGDELVAGLLETLPGGAYGMLLLTMVVIFFLGFVLEFVEIIFIVVPIVGPIILQSDISPVWFAVLIAMNLQTSFLTPPFGFALFYFRSVAPREISTGTIYKAIIPFVLIQIVAIGCVAMFPSLATWLPDALF